MYMFDRVALCAYALVHNRYPLNFVPHHSVHRNRRATVSVCSSKLCLQADWASLSGAFPLLVGCACPHLVCICIVFINTSYEEKAPKHGHGTSRSSVAGPGRPLLSVLLLWLPCIPPPASPLALAGPNAEPSNSGKEQGLAQGRALAGQLGTCRYRPGPGPGRTFPLPLAHQGSSETPGRRALRWGPPSPRHRRRPLKAEIQQGACIWKSAAAAGEEAH